MSIMEDEFDFVYDDDEKFQDVHQSNEKLSHSDSIESINDEEVPDENNDFSKISKLALQYSQLLRLVNEMESVYKRVQSWVKCKECINKDHMFISLEQVADTKGLHVRLFFKKPQKLGACSLNLVYPTQTGEFTQSKHLDITKSSRVNFHVTPPPNCKEIKKAYIFGSFDIDESKYSKAKELYESFQSHEGMDEEMDDISKYDNSDTDDLSKHDNSDIEPMPSALIGNFTCEGTAILNDILTDDNKDDVQKPIRNSKKESEDSDSDDESDSILSHPKESSVAQIYTFNLDIHLKDIC